MTSGCKRLLGGGWGIWQKPVKSWVGKRILIGNKFITVSHSLRTRGIKWSHHVAVPTRTGGRTPLRATQAVEGCHRWYHKLTFAQRLFQKFLEEKKKSPSSITKPRTTTLVWEEPKLQVSKELRREMPAPVHPALPRRPPRAASYRDTPLFVLNNK